MDDSAAPPSGVLQQDGASFLALTSIVMFQGCRDALVALTPKDEQLIPRSISIPFNSDSAYWLFFCWPKAVNVANLLIHVTDDWT